MAARPARVRFIAVQFALAAVVAVALWLSYPGWRLGHITESVRRRFPDVQWISSGDLASWMASEKRVKPIILDVRSPAEFQVSHLFEAHRADPEEELRAADLPDDHRRALVVYCSTGERSAAFARRLQRAGYESVYTLEGSIVRWANESRPLTDDHGLVTRVHSDDAQTVGLLKEAHRAGMPAPH